MNSQPLAPGPNDSCKRAFWRGFWLGVIVAASLILAASFAPLFLGLDPVASRPLPNREASPAIVPPAPQQSRFCFSGFIRFHQSPVSENARNHS